MNDLTERIISHPFFRDMKPEHLAVLTECATEARFEVGEVLFRESEPADRFFLIESGVVVLEAHEPADGTMLVQEIGPGEVLGWSWLFSPFTWRLGARAVEPTTAIVLRGGHLLTRAENDHDFGYELMKRVVQLVVYRLQATRNQLFSSHSETSIAD
jgi:CRP-like cAMP-binding protein